MPPMPPPPAVSRAPPMSTPVPFPLVRHSSVNGMPTKLSLSVRLSSELANLSTASSRASSFFGLSVLIGSSSHLHWGKRKALLSSVLPENPFVRSCSSAARSFCANSSRRSGVSSSEAYACARSPSSSSSSKLSFALWNSSWLEPQLDSESGRVPCWWQSGMRSGCRLTGKHSPDEPRMMNFPRRAPDPEHTETVPPLPLPGAFGRSGESHDRRLLMSFSSLFESLLDRFELGVACRMKIVDWSSFSPAAPAARLSVAFVAPASPTTGQVVFWRNASRHLFSSRRISSSSNCCDGSARLLRLGDLLQQRTLAPRVHYPRHVVQVLDLQRLVVLERLHSSTASSSGNVQNWSDSCESPSARTSPPSRALANTVCIVSGSALSSLPSCRISTSHRGSSHSSQSSIVSHCLPVITFREMRRLPSSTVAFRSSQSKLKLSPRGGRCCLRLRACRASALTVWPRKWSRSVASIVRSTKCRSPSNTDVSFPSSSGSRLTLKGGKKRNRVTLLLRTATSTPYDTYLQSSCNFCITSRTTSSESDSSICASFFCTFDHQGRSHGSITSAILTLIYHGARCGLSSRSNGKAATPHGTLRDLSTLRGAFATKIRLSRREGETKTASERKHHQHAPTIKNKITFASMMMMLLLLLLLLLLLGSARPPISQTDLRMTEDPK
uniref:Transmembrane protein n=1 Tax=Anopheles atroparvus TaxID=41427 RepID=A0A182IJ48_ANOAO